MKRTYTIDGDMTIEEQRVLLIRIQDGLHDMAYAALNDNNGRLLSHYQDVQRALVEVQLDLIEAMEAERASNNHKPQETV